jgi:hypothetical protein
MHRDALLADDLLTEEREAARYKQVTCLLRRGRLQAGDLLIEEGGGSCKLQTHLRF